MADDTSPKLFVSKIAEMFGFSRQAVHTRMKNLGIECPRVSRGSYVTHDIAKKFFKIKFNHKKISFQIVKGGTGKTTTLYNVACCASLYGARLLLIDLDPQGNLTDCFRINADEKPVMIDIINDNIDISDAIIRNVEQGIDIIPSRIENVTLDSKLALSKSPLHLLFDNIFEELHNEYDYIFIDCPPTMGHSVTASTLYTKMVVAPLNPDKFSAKGLDILKNEITNIENQYKRKIYYKVFLNKFSGNTLLSDKAIQTTISLEATRGNALNTAIRQTQEIPNAIDSNKNLFASIKKSTARDDFDLLTRELLEININSDNYALNR